MTSLKHAVLVTFAALTLSANAVASLQNCQLRLGWDTWQPFHFAENDRVTGLDISLIETLLKEIGCGVSYHQMPWTRQLNALDKGAIDVVPGAYYNIERASWANFSKPYRYERSAIFVKRDGPFTGLISSLDDIVPLQFRIAMTRGGYLGERHKALLKSERYRRQIFYSPNDSKMREMLLRGRIDGYVKEIASEQNALRIQGLESEVVALPDEIYRSGVHLMFNRSVDKGIIERFNSALAAHLAREDTKQSPVLSTNN